MDLQLQNMHGMLEPPGPENLANMGGMLERPGHETFEVNVW